MANPDAKPAYRGEIMLPREAGHKNAMNYKQTVLHVLWLIHLTLRKCYFDV